MVFTPEGPSLETYLGLAEDEPPPADTIAGLMVQHHSERSARWRSTVSGKYTE